MCFEWKITIPLELQYTLHVHKCPDSSCCDHMSVKTSPKGAFYLWQNGGKNRWGYWQMWHPEWEWYILLHPCRVHCHQSIFLTPFLQTCSFIYHYNFRSIFISFCHLNSDDLLLSLRYVCTAASLLTMSVNVRFNPVKRPVLQFYIRHMRNDPLKDNAHWRQQENLLFGNI